MPGAQFIHCWYFFLHLLLIVSLLTIKYLPDMSDHGHLFQHLLWQQKWRWLLIIKSKCCTNLCLLPDNMQCVRKYSCVVPFTWANRLRHCVEVNCFNSPYSLCYVYSSYRSVVPLPVPPSPPPCTLEWKLQVQTWTNIPPYTHAPDSLPDQMRPLEFLHLSDFQLILSFWVRCLSNLAQTINTCSLQLDVK